MPCTRTISGTPGRGSPTARLRIRPRTPSWYETVTCAGNSGMTWFVPAGSGHQPAVGMPREVAGFDSASGMVVALARYLHGGDTPPLGKPAFRALRPVAALAARLREGARQWVYSVFSGAEGRPPADIARLDLEAV